MPWVWHRVIGMNPDGVQDTGNCQMQVYLATPRGFCAGVDRAIEIVERALELFGAPIYVRHEVVHNRFVVEDLRTKGAVFVDDLDQVPAGATVIFSAHGVSRGVREEAARCNLRVFDATCPLVTKVHMEVTRHRNNGTECILIGHAGHPEVEGTRSMRASCACCRRQCPVADRPPHTTIQHRRHREVVPCR